MQITEYLINLISSKLNLPFDEQKQIVRFLSQPPTLDMGDIAFPCFHFAKRYGETPSQIAAKLFSSIEPDFLVGEVYAKGPYVNFFLNRAESTRIVLTEILKSRDKYGSQDIGKGRVIVLDYSHPNIAKLFHFGHLRSTYLGAQLARIFKFCGYDVWRQNYLGDWGTQFGFIIYSWQKYGDEKLLQEQTTRHLVDLYIKVNQESESDPRIREIARDNFRRLEAGDPEIRALWQRFRDLSIRAFKKSYERLGINFDSYEGEASINKKVAPLVDRFLKSGAARVSEGAVIVDVGDIIGREIAPLMLRKSDGASTYAARDCAEAIDRWEKYKFEGNIYVVARQEDHFAQVFAALKKLALAENWDVIWPDRCENVSFGYVRGMSTRRGEAVWLDDVLDEAKVRAKKMRFRNEKLYPGRLPKLNNDELEKVNEAVGQAAILHSNVAARRLASITFDWDSILQFEGNTGPYLQYTYARISGIFRNAEEKEIFVEDNWLIDKEHANLITSDEEWLLILKLRGFTSIVQRALEIREPNEISKFLHELATLCNRFYHQHKVVDPENLPLTHARLSLLKATQAVLGIGLNILGIRILNKM